ncbi:NAD-dependent deacetylase [Planctomycetota bacterium]
MELDEVKSRIANSGAVVGFTGAGISTESGIADYRGTGGIWTKYRVVTIQEFLASDEGRREYWKRKADLWASARDAEPNEGHQTFARLHKQGKLLGLITQNIDGLHQKAGVPDEKIVELHGTNLRCSCLDCGYPMPTREAMDEWKSSGEPPACPECGGWMKPATISFGQSLNEADLQRASSLCANADVLIAAGSSLTVQPAAGFPVLAKQNGALLVIVNRNETALDDMADAVIQGEIGTILPELVCSG